MKSFNKNLQALVFTAAFTSAMLPTLFCFEGFAFGRSSAEAPYPVDQIWSTVVRFLRVDQRFPVLEKDRDAGYILFDYVEEPTKIHKASLELVSIVQTDGRSGTKVILTIPDKPRHVEVLLLEKLQKKTAEELGAPAPAPPRPKRDADKPPEPSKPKRPKDSEKEEDPNQPVRGDDGLPRLPHHNDFPRGE